MKRIIVFLIVNNLIFSYSEENNDSFKNYSPTKINEKIEIDGNLNETIWNQDGSIDDFIQIEPNYNSIPSALSTVQALYDDDFIYFGIVLFDNMSTVKFKLGEYDDWENTFDEDSDYFSIEIDSYHDHQNAYVFAINSSGVMADSKYYDGYYDDNWNGDWESSVKADHEKWTIEVKIPIKNLRFQNKDDITMGINFLRYKNSTNEYISWSKFPLNSQDEIIKFYGHFIGLNFDMKNILSVTPYLQYSQASYDDYYYQDFEYDNMTNEIVGLTSPDNFKKDYHNENIGIDINYLLKSNLSLDLTFNPSFQHLQEDPAEVNNSAFETFYEENRLFFIKDNSIFNTPINIFYSRRVGKESIKYQYVENSEVKFVELYSKLDAAIKLTGKNFNDMTYGLIVAQAGTYDDMQNFNNNKAIYSVFRSKKHYNKNNSYIGFINTNYNFRDSRAHVYSIDGLINFNNSGFEFSYQLAQSKINNISGIGLSSEIDYFSKIIKKSKFTYEVVSWFKYDLFDKNFNISNSGYIYRNNLESYNLGVAINFFEKLNNISESKVVLQYLKNKNYSGVTLDDIYSIEWGAKLINNWGVNLSLSISGPTYIDRFYDDYFYSNFYQVEIDKYIKRSPENNIVFNFNSDSRKKVSFSTMLNYFKNDINDDGTAYSFVSRFKPTQRVDFEFSFYDLSYYKTYNFLKIRMIPIGNTHDIHGFSSSHPTNQNYSRNDFQYLFTNSNNSEKIYSFNISGYIRNNFSVQFFVEYFMHDNKWIGKKYFINSDNQSANFIFPEEDLNGTISLIEDDKLLYSSTYTSLLSNINFNWESIKGYKLTFGYVYNKEINGKVFNRFLDLVDFNSSQINNGNKAELFFNKTFFIKYEFNI